jgi:hypothetical protein
VVGIDSSRSCSADSSAISGSERQPQQSHIAPPTVEARRADETGPEVLWVERFHEGYDFVMGFSRGPRPMLPGSTFGASKQADEARICAYVAIG